MKIWDTQQTFDDSQNNFFRCCNSIKLIQYECKHEPQPIHLEGFFLNAIEMLLWYIPNIDSVQSEKIDLIEEEIYDEFTYKFFLENMNLSDNDICWYRRDRGKNPKVQQEVPQNLWDFYHSDLCVSCQKMAIVIHKGQSRVKNILRCIRNSIAHGDFYIVGDTIVGFNCDKSIRTAIVKFKPSQLLKTLKKMQHIYVRERLFSFAFEKLGYTITNGTRTLIENYPFMFDFEMTKEGHTYAVEIKSEEHKGYFEDKKIDGMIALYGRAISNRSITLVIVIDNSKLKVSHKNKLQGQGFVILDKSAVKDLLNGTDVLSLNSD